MGWRTGYGGGAAGRRSVRVNRGCRGRGALGSSEEACLLLLAVALPLGQGRELVLGHAEHFREVAVREVELLLGQVDVHGLGALLALLQLLEAERRGAGQHRGLGLGAQLGNGGLALLLGSLQAGLGLGVVGRVADAGSLLGVHAARGRGSGCGGGLGGLLGLGGSLFDLGLGLGLGLGLLRLGGSLLGLGLLRLELCNRSSAALLRCLLVRLALGAAGLLLLPDPLKLGLVRVREGLGLGSFPALEV
mmetsp:Transcript_8377/g.33051  ORF Transcript_8377/g.33051 Transcript_8377/m.33051 type:complete len:248 (+) Transcript_8377:137-880(+)